ncbi:MAG TPA: MJ0042-type zinc finger domain-containing protein [Sphingomicrobium sp.]|nr:MJ0042-type zinc finger domain-containing protein [Sphingomicrobium sp.]
MLLNSVNRFREAPSRMILTCPACDTKYVVKDDAIPPGGRQVRCASCKHSWHQDAEFVAREAASEGEGEWGGPPVPGEEQVEEPIAAVPEAQAAEAMIAGEPQPAADHQEESPWGAIASEPGETTMALAGAAGPDEMAMEEAPAIADEWRAQPAEQIAAAPSTAETEEDFAAYAPIEDEQGRAPRRWPLIIGILLLVVAAAAAFWFFAPPEWKARAGLAQAGATPLQLMITTSDRQSLQSGNELVAISGRVINPTDREQQVPPIIAELRDKQSQRVVHRWTIPPPARALAPGTSASFNSAEVDVPKGGDELTVTLGS